MLENYAYADAFLQVSTNEIIDSIRSTARFGLSYAFNKYHALVQAATDAKVFGSSVYRRVNIDHPEIQAAVDLMLYKLFHSIQQEQNIE